MSPKHRILRPVKSVMLASLLLQGSFLFSQNPYNLKIVNKISDYRNTVYQSTDNEFVDIEKEIPGLITDVRYATRNNFTGKRVYKDNTVLLRRPVADSLKRVQEELKKLGYTLIVFDAYRPYSVSLKFYRIYPDTNYVASPRKGSKHNTGCAVDVSVASSETGKEIEMPTGFDDFSPKAWLNYTDLPEQALKNRELLKNVMSKYGFIPYEAEWWHYTYYNWRRFELTDIPSGKLKKIKSSKQKI